MSLFSRIKRKVRKSFQKESFALNELDKKLAGHLTARNGFFIEAGANDGVRQSNTLYFEKYRGWKGLLVEAVPELAAKCRKNRPHCIVENCALVPFGFKDDHIVMTYCNLMSHVRGIVGDEKEEEEWNQFGVEMQKNVEETYEFKAKTRTLTDVLDQHGITEVDLFSLDVEGFEMSVLEGLDLERLCPKFLLIEMWEKKADELAAFLEPHFEVVANLSHHDVLYRSRKSAGSG